MLVNKSEQIQRVKTSEMSFYFCMEIEIHFSYRVSLKPWLKKNLYLDVLKEVKNILCLISATKVCKMNMRI